MIRFASVAFLAALLSACQQMPAPPPPAHTVTVEWKPSEPGPERFNLYRNREPVFPVPVSVTSFIDTNVTVGGRYCYDVVVIENGIDSAPSNTACAIP